MANQLQPYEPSRIGRRRQRGSEDEEEEHEDDEDSLEKLEEQVKETAEKLTHYRSTLPDQLKSSLASFLAAQRPQLSVIDDGSQPGPSGDPNPGSGDDIRIGALDVGKDHETAEKISLLKDKMSRNVSAVPILLKRMNDCISRIDKLNSLNEIIHPVFKRKKG